MLHQLVTTCPVIMLLKNEVFGLKNAKRINSLPEESLKLTGEGLGSVFCRISMRSTGRVVTVSLN